MNEELTRTASKRTAEFLAAQPPRAADRPDYDSLAALTTDLKGCTVCPWAGAATQAVSGEGPTTAPLMLVGEQPGDREDLADRPFVGPAGQLLDQALQAAGIDRQAAYVTNAVKHFKFEQRGKRRLHAKPNATDVAACRSWLVAELAFVRPRVLVCLGATAALSVFGKQVRLGAMRGQWHSVAACSRTLVTNHPSAILRMPPDAQQAGFAALVADLQMAQAELSAPGHANA